MYKMRRNNPFMLGHVEERIRGNRCLLGEKYPGGISPGTMSLCLNVALCLINLSGFEALSVDETAL